jgi:hypothetical protein
MPPLFWDFDLVKLWAGVVLSTLPLAAVLAALAYLLCKPPSPPSPPK